jgi:hypothetical protein
MKLCDQSMTRMAEWDGYPAVLRDILDGVRDPATELHVAGITETGGVGDQSRYLEFLETAEILKNVARAVRQAPPRHGWPVHLQECVYAPPPPTLIETFRRHYGQTSIRR